MKDSADLLHLVAIPRKCFILPNMRSIALRSLYSSSTYCRLNCYKSANCYIGAVLSASCACAWIRETSAVGIHDVPDSNGVTVVFPLFAIILRIRAFLAASMPTHWTPVHGLILF